MEFFSKDEMKEIVAFNLWILQDYLSNMDINVSFSHYEFDKRLDNFQSDIFAESDKGQKIWIFCQKQSNIPDNLVKFINSILHNEQNIIIWIAERWNPKVLDVAREINKNCGREIIYPLRIQFKPKEERNYMLNLPK